MAMIEIAGRRGAARRPAAPARPGSRSARAEGLRAAPSRLWLLPARRRQAGFEAGRPSAQRRRLQVFQQGLALPAAPPEERPGISSRRDPPLLQAEPRLRRGGLRRQAREASRLQANPARGRRQEPPLRRPPPPTPRSQDMRAAASRMPRSPRLPLAGRRPESQDLARVAAGFGTSIANNHYSAFTSLSRSRVPSRSSKSLRSMSGMLMSASRDCGPTTATSPASGYS